MNSCYISVVKMAVRLLEMSEQPRAGCRRRDLRDAGVGIFSFRAKIPVDAGFRSPPALGCGEKFGGL
jgi:hypothetical protein